MNLEGTYYRRMFCGNEMVHCGVLREVGLMAGKLLNWEAIELRENKVDRERQSSNKELKKKLHEARKAIGLLQGALEGYERNQRKKRGTTERESCSSSGGSQKSKENRG